MSSCVARLAPDCLQVRLLESFIIKSLVVTILQLPIDLLGNSACLKVKYTDEMWGEEAEHHQFLWKCTALRKSWFLFALHHIILFLSSLLGCAWKILRRLMVLWGGSKNGLVIHFHLSIFILTRHMKWIVDDWFGEQACLHETRKVGKRYFSHLFNCLSFLARLLGHGISSTTSVQSVICVSTFSCLLIEATTEGYMLWKGFLANL
jgi:hypothetical protein